MTDFASKTKRAIFTHEYIFLPLRLFRNLVSFSFSLEVLMFPCVFYMHFRIVFQKRCKISCETRAAINGVLLMLLLRTSQKGKKCFCPAELLSLLSVCNVLMTVIGYIIKRHVKSYGAISGLSCQTFGLIKHLLFTVYVFLSSVHYICLLDKVVDYHLKKENLQFKTFTVISNVHVRCC